MTTPVYLSDADLQNLDISNREIIQAIELAIVGAYNGHVSAAPKTATRTSDGRYLMATLAASDDAGFIVVKSVISNQRNKARGLPAVNGGMMLLDSETGALMAVLDANWVTAVRTAGLSAVAARRLADPASRSIALVGAGVQAESHLRALAEMFPLNGVYASGRGRQGLERIAIVAEELGMSFEQTTPEQGLRKADIVVSSVSLDATSSPFVDAHWLKSGAFAAIIDQGGPWLAPSYAAFRRVYVDNVAQEKVMEKPLVDSDLVTGELTDLVVADVSYDPALTSAFIFRGIAVGDLAVAALAFKRSVHFKG